MIAPTNKRHYVTAFPGRRDQYQLPLSLSENGRLDRFATCFYRGRGILGRIPQVGARMGQRHADGIPEERVDCLEMTNIAARLGCRVIQPSRVGMWEDTAFARRAVELARRSRASLLLYEFQADWAFRQPIDHDPVRVLFQFHTHPDLEHPLLIRDGQHYPLFLEQIHADTRTNLPEAYRRHTRDAWRHADHVIVASEFTASSLRLAGCPQERISIVPYGVDIAPESECGEVPAAAAGRPYFLFVGSGVHRKGLHHLLVSWSRSALHESHDLVLVARVIDPAMLGSIGSARSVRLVPGVPRARLTAIYKGAKAFVMPSLSEGFGHVYLEALANGCPVVGTRNSMLPDFTEAQANIRLVEPCDTVGLQAALESIAGMSPGDPFFDTRETRKGIRRYTWQAFRQGIEDVLRRFD